jgi:hypothetical protein
MPCWSRSSTEKYLVDVTQERALSPADMFGGKVPVEALIGLLERIC